MQKFEILSTIKEEKIVAVIRGKDSDEATSISLAAIEGGIRIIELTYTTPFVEKVFKDLENEDVLIGAGSVLDPETARHALLNGAKFIVSPFFNKDVATMCNRYGIPYLPGCMTVKEMAEALEAGCDILKLFPANDFEPSIIGSIRGPIPNVNIMPTGGVNLSNMSGWLSAGAIAVGIGSDLNNAYNSGSHELVVEVTKKYVEKLKENT
ncbi:bifunctional 2-keto-4-hydroxyglutarate aldolase/2-keto-3-deoxy-6-phosphogluconate aldolase [Paenisporosarcina macmurdoensis]|uniref:Bifunctional 2-keto-4-hydroxyglutarate aldolase/2-keto-3-deoxy-6-phosphogluconate aldolase n=1 Tax=Paenisporosarcina macmurdoensis TaxID=212659 RepID=A0ABW1L0P9_9BACL